MIRAFLVAQLVKKSPAKNPGRPGFDPWVGKIPWRRERLPTPVFWPREFVDCIVHGVTKSLTQLSDFHFTSVYDPANISNLNSCSSDFSKPSLGVWKFLIHIILKSSMQYFKHDLTSIRDEYNCLMVSTFFSTTFLGN